MQIVVIAIKQSENKIIKVNIKFKSNEKKLKNK